MADEVMVHKATLSSGKVVLLREFKIKHQRLAAQACSGGSENPTAMGVQMAEEILKLLIIRINDQEVPKNALEDLDSIFTYQDYQELLKVIGKLMGDNNADPKMEVVSYGAQ